MQTLRTGSNVVVRSSLANKSTICRPRPFLQQACALVIKAEMTRVCQSKSPVPAARYVVRRVRGAVSWSRGPGMDR